MLESLYEEFSVRILYINSLNIRSKAISQYVGFFFLLNYLLSVIKML